MRTFEHYKAKCYTQAGITDTQFREDNFQVLILRTINKVPNITEQEFTNLTNFDDMCDAELMNIKYIFNYFKLSRAICITNRISFVSEAQTKLYGYMVKPDNSLLFFMELQGHFKAILESLNEIHSNQPSVPGLEFYSDMAELSFQEEKLSVAINIVDLFQFKLLG